MSDNVSLPGTGQVIAADLLPDGSKAQRVKLITGADGVDDGNVTSANPLPVGGAALGTQADAEASGNGSIIGLLKRLRTLLGGVLTVRGTRNNDGSDVIAGAFHLTVGGSDGVNLRPLLTDTQGRAVVAVSGTVPVSGPLTDAQLRAAAVPVAGPLTDAQLRSAAVPVSGPLTDAQLRQNPILGESNGELAEAIRALQLAINQLSSNLASALPNAAGQQIIEARQATAANLNATVSQATAANLNATISLAASQTLAAVTSLNQAGGYPINALMPTLSDIAQAGIRAQIVTT